MLRVKGFFPGCSGGSTPHAAAAAAGGGAAGDGGFGEKAADLSVFPLPSASPGASAEPGRPAANGG